MKLDVVLAPRFLRRDTLKGSWCIVIDVLRAATTIVVALASGAAEVRPCRNASEARKLAGSQCSGSCLLGGERMGRRIPGFDLGNSPLDYLAPGVVVGKTIFFSTTNGTAAIRKAYRDSGLPVYIGALLNVSSVSAAIVRAAIEGPAAGVAILCSGRQGGLAAEGLFCAGLMVRKVVEGLRGAGLAPILSDGAMMAEGFAVANEGQALQVLATSEHGRYLRSIGFAADLEFASRLDGYDIVPIFDGRRVVAMQDVGE